jgi:ankyrin repeat protein
MDQNLEDLLEICDGVNSHREGWTLYLSLFALNGYKDSRALQLLRNVREAKEYDYSSNPLFSDVCISNAIHSKGQSNLWHRFASASPLGAVLTELFGLETSKDVKTPSGTHWGRTLSSLGVELKENMLQVLQGQIELAGAPDTVQVVDAYANSTFLLPKLDIVGTCYLVTTLGNFKVIEDYWRSHPESGPNVLIKMELQKPTGCLHGECGIHPLALATILDDSKLAEYLLKKGANPNLSDNTFYSALQVAVFMRKEKMVKMFLKTSSVDMVPCHPVSIAACLSSKEVLAALAQSKAVGSDLNFLDAQTLSSPLMAAIVSGELAKVKVLTKRRVSFELSDSQGYTPLHYAIHAESHSASSGMKIVKHILSCNLNAVNISSSKKLTPLHLAAYMGHPEMCKVLLKKGAKFDSTDNAGRTVLHWAVISQERDCLKFLLTNQDCASLVNHKDLCGAGPLHYAAFLGLSEHVQLLVSKAAEVNAECKQGTTPLVWAIASVQTETVRMLVSKGADVNHTCSWQQAVLSLEDRSIVPSQPLLAAARVGSEEIVKFLLDMGVKVDGRGSDGSTALHHASVMGHTECMKVLLRANAPVDALTDWKETSLHLASMHSHSEAVTLLLKGKASPLIRHPNRSNSVLHLSTMHGRADCLRVLLIEGKCNVNTTRPSDSWTPLHTAAACGEEQCVQCLLDHGAKVNAVDTSIEKCSPLDIALREGHMRTAHLLIQAGAQTSGGVHHRAASLIQAVWRFHVHKRRKALGSAWAANRVKSAAKKVALKKRATRLRMVRERERNSAACVIQKHWREYIARKRRYEATVRQLRSKIQSERDGYSIIVRELRQQCLSVQLPSSRKPQSTISSKALLKGPKSPPFPDCGNSRKQPIAKPQDMDSLMTMRKNALKKHGVSKKETKTSKNPKSEQNTTKALQEEKEDMKEIHKLLRKAAEMQADDNKLPDIPKGRLSVVSPSNSKEAVAPVRSGLAEQTNTSGGGDGKKSQSYSHSGVKLCPIQPPVHNGSLNRRRSSETNVGMWNSKDVMRYMQAYIFSPLGCI